jgi:monothiol glutaredoxin
MDEQTKEQISKMINENKNFLFMKGTPEQPQCGFSARVVHILKKMDINFTSFDVLSNNNIREGIKEYSNWPTIPQLYSNQKLIGGCDVVVQLEEEGKLQALL